MIYTWLISKRVRLRGIFGVLGCIFGVFRGIFEVLGGIFEVFRGIFGVSGYNDGNIDLRYSYFESDCL